MCQLCPIDSAHMSRRSSRLEAKRAAGIVPRWKVGLEAERAAELEEKEEERREAREEARRKAQEEERKTRRVFRACVRCTMQWPFDVDRGDHHYGRAMCTRVQVDRVDGDMEVFDSDLPNTGWFHSHGQKELIIRCPEGKEPREPVFPVARLPSGAVVREGVVHAKILGLSARRDETVDWCDVPIAWGEIK